jgi:hypothetical protein
VTLPFCLGVVRTLCSLLAVIVKVGMRSTDISYISPPLTDIEGILPAICVNVLHNGLFYPRLWVDPVL